MKENNGRKILTSFAESVHTDRGWWHIVPRLGKHDENKDAKSVILMIITVLGLYDNVMEICFDINRLLAQERRIDTSFY